MRTFKKLINIFMTIQIMMVCIIQAIYCTGSDGKLENTSANVQNKPKVSVVVPVYKVEPWIIKFLDSIKNQTLKEIEIICVDDGSPDNCGKILDEYAAVDSRFIVVHQKNKGVSEARNAGLDFASGEYITFADPDDYLQLDAYDIAYNAIKKDNADMIQFGHCVFRDGDTRNVRKVTNNCHNEVVVDRDTFMLKYANDYNWNKLYKTELIKENNII